MANNLNAIYADEAERLMRTTWNSPQELAEELYAILTAQLTIHGPLNIQQDGTTPAINIIPSSTNPDGTNGITFGPPPTFNPLDPLVQWPPGGSGGGSGGTGITPDQIDWPGLNPLGASPLFPITTTGIVVGKVGGQVYSVAVYVQDPSSGFPITTMPAFCGPIDVNETIPNGTEVLITLFPVAAAGNRFVINSARFLVPVWFPSP